ncbi:MAG: GNAT family N-acetyltransferase [Planctomycetes bacterium]|nr:GNAT family N-acetyltransferase [Planctomycetota bacterium]
MPRIRLRSIVKDDREFLYRCYASTRTEELSVVPWSDADKDQFLRMQFHAQSDHYEKHYRQAQFQVILVDEVPAGRLYVDRWPKEIRIVDITLLPAFRGHGIGSTLLQTLIEESESAGKPLSIHVEKNNPAMRLYLRLGFVPVGEVGVYDLMQRPVSSKE